MIRYFDSSVKKKTDLFDTVIFSNWGFYFCLFFFVIPYQTKIDAALNISKHLHTLFILINYSPVFFFYVFMFMCPRLILNIAFQYHEFLV